MNRTRRSNSNLAPFDAAPPVALWKRAGESSGAVTALVHELRPQALNPAHVFDLGGALGHLYAADGGYEIVHESARLEFGIYVLIAPEPDRQRTNGNDAVYLILEGRGTLDLNGERIELCEGRAAFVPAGVNFRFSAYEQLSVLVIANRGTSERSIGASPEPET